VVGGWGLVLAALRLGLKEVPAVTIADLDDADVEGSAARGGSLPGRACRYKSGDRENGVQATPWATRHHPFSRVIVQLKGAATQVDTQRSRTQDACRVPNFRHTAVLQ